MKLEDLDPAELALRLGLAALAGAGAVVAMYASLVSDLAPAIPYRWIPDLRPVVLFGATAGIAAFAAWGPGRRRGFLIAYLLALHGVFAFELGTIHWFIPYPGPIGGSRADPLRLLSALSGLLVAVLLQVRAHADATHRDLQRRGVPSPQAAATARALRDRGSRAAILAGAGAAATAALVELAAAAMGDEGSFSIPAALLAGAAVLLAAGLAVGAAARRPRAPPPAVTGRTG